MASLLGTIGLRTKFHHNRSGFVDFISKKHFGVFFRFIVYKSINSKFVEQSGVVGLSRTLSELRRNLSNYGLLFNSV